MGILNRQEAAEHEVLVLTRSPMTWPLALIKGQFGQVRKKKEGSVSHRMSGLIQRWLRNGYSEC